MTTATHAESQRGSEAASAAGGETLVEVQDLCKSYGPVRALDRVSFQVREGQVLGFLGPNGAGKSTTLRILAGFLPGDAGRVLVGGHDVGRESLAVRRIVGYLPEGVPLYPDLRVSEYLRFRARIKGVPRRERRRAIEGALEAAGIGDVRRRIIGTLSRGYRQRVGLADALLHEPRVLILDEPTVGLDPEQVRQFRRLLRDVGRDRTVILSTHILAEVEAVCTDVVIIREGRIAAEGSAERLRSLVGEGSCVVCEIAGPAQRVAPRLEQIPGVVRVAREPGASAPSASSGARTGGESTGPAAGRDDAWGRYRLFGSGDRDLREGVYDAARAEGWRLRRLEDEVLSLEDVFLTIVGRDT